MRSHADAHLHILLTNAPSSSSLGLLSMMAPVCWLLLQQEAAFVATPSC